MLQISGTTAGRVFMRGTNKDLYELEYSSDSSWLFGSGAKVRVVNKTTTGLAAVIPSVFGTAGESTPYASPFAVLTFRQARKG